MYAIRSYYGVAAGDFTAREVAEAFNAAVADAAALNAFIVTTPDHALAAADAVDAKRAKAEAQAEVNPRRSGAPSWGSSGRHLLDNSGPLAAAIFPEAARRRGRAHVYPDSRAITPQLAAYPRESRNNFV